MGERRGVGIGVKTSMKHEVSVWKVTAIPASRSSDRKQISPTSPEIARCPMRLPEILSI